MRTYIDMLAISMIAMAIFGFIMARRERAARNKKSVKCSHCEIEIWRECLTPSYGYDHPGLCCDCYDLSWWHDTPEIVEQINAARIEAGRPPITKPWKEKE